MSEFVRVPPPRLLGVLGDVHWPREDKVALDLVTRTMLGTMEQLGISREDTELMGTGDAFDTAWASPHPSLKRSSVHGGLVSDEKRAAKPWIDSWLGCFGRVRFLGGNHEAWQQGVTELAGQQWWEVYGNLLDGCHVHPEGTQIRYGSLLACHGHELRGAMSAESASKVLAQYPGQNTIYGHTHRVQGCTTPTTKYGEPVGHGAWTVGMLREREGERLDRKMRPFNDRHQQGFGMVYFTRSGFKVELVEIFSKGSKRWCVAAGREYKC
jgi:hypothetical protein